MKTLFAILFISLSFSHSSQACPNFSGKYERAVVIDGFDPKLEITQTGCNEITMHYNFNGDLYTRVIQIDGQKHTSRSGDTTMIESYTWNGEKILVDGEYHYQNDINYGKGIIQFESNIGIFSEETDYTAAGCSLDLCKAHESERYRMIQ